MINFRIIPVLDILNSEVVHAVKGQRENYKPLKTELFNSINPIKVVKEFTKRYEMKELYIADLDAIIKKTPNIRILREITKNSELKLIIDPGIETKKDFFLYSNLNINKLILGLETIRDTKTISDCLLSFGSERTIVSIDMFNESIKTNIVEFQDLPLLKIINKIEALGVNEIILLDLYKVGQKSGGIPAIYQKIRNQFKGEILVGGGIKDYNNLLEYYNNDFSGVLIGTALYDGTIPVNRIRKFSYINL